MSKELSKLSHEDIEQKVWREIGRCLIHMQTGLFEATRKDILHIRLIEYMHKEVTTETPSIALSMRHNGFVMMINPQFFLVHLQTTQQRSSALRHVEQNLFMMWALDS